MTHPASSSANPPSPSFPAPLGGRGVFPLATVLFDPDVSARESLRHLLTRHPALEAVGSMGSLDKARRVMDEAAPRLLFVDPAGCDATLHWLESRPPSLDVIFVTADADLAARAFELDALGFLPKPVAPERLGQVVRRLLRLDWQASTSAEASTSERVFVAFERGRRLVALDEICAIRAFGNYTQVQLANGCTEIVLRSLRRWEETLPTGRFLRIHRGGLVNAHRIREVVRTDADEGHAVALRGVAEPLPVSRRLVAGLKRALAGGRPAVHGG